MSSGRPKTFGLFAVVILALGAGALYFASVKPSNEPSGLRTSSAPADTLDRGKAIKTPPPAIGAKPATTDFAAAARALKMGDKLQNPKTQKELEWLLRNGYPSEEQRAYANSIRGTVGGLNQATPATAESIIQATNLAMMSPNDREAALAHLRDAAADGSIYALQSLGAANSLGPSGNRTVAQAYYNAARARGEWNEVFRGDGELSPDQDALAELMGQQIILNLNRLRAQRGLPPLGFDPRPGLDDALRQMQEFQSRGTDATSGN